VQHGRAIGPSGLVGVPVIRSLPSPPPPNADLIKLAAALPLRFSLPGLRPLVVQHPTVIFFHRRTRVCQGEAIFAPGTGTAAIRIDFPEAVRHAFETLDGPNKVRHIRHGGAFGLMFPFFGAPIRNSWFRSLRFHWSFGGPKRPAATPSFQVKDTVWLFIRLIYG
jgi:hypothetical protein